MQAVLRRTSSKKGLEQAAGKPFQNARKSAKKVWKNAWQVNIRCDMICKLSPERLRKCNLEGKTQTKKLQKVFKKVLKNAWQLDIICDMIHKLSPESKVA